MMCYKKISYFIYLSLFLGFAINTLASTLQTQDDLTYDNFDLDLNALENLEIGTKTEKKTQSKLVNRLSNAISGSIGYSTVFSGGGTGRNYSFLHLRYEDKFKGLKLVLDGKTEDVEIKIEQELDDQYCNNSNNDCTGLAKTRILEYQNDRTFLDEGYAEFDIGSIAVLSAGKKKIIWGQFEPYSPVNFAFPMNLGVTDLRYSKLSGGMGQEVISLAVYPHPRISLTGYYFPTLTMDPLLKTRIENSFETSSTPSVSGSDIIWNQTTVETIPLPSGSDEKQYAARLMFFPTFGTIGFTYHEGYDVKWGVADFDIVQILQDGGSNYIDTDGDNFYYIKPRTGISEQKLYGFELAVPVKRWTYKMEIASIKTTYSLRPNNSTSEVFSHALNKKDPSSLPSWYRGNYELAKEYADFIYNENGGKLYFPYLQNIVSVGADANLDRWLMNFAIFFLHPIYLNSKEKRIAEIEEQAFPSDDEDDLNFFPMFNVGRYNKNKTAITGIAAGVIANGVGFSLYYSRDFKEALRFSASFLGIDYFSNDAVENQNSNTDEYTSGDGIDVGFGVRIEYKF